MDSTEVNQTSSANRQIAKAAGTIMIPMVLGQILSLVASILIGRLYGMGDQNDAYIAANILPNFLYNLVAGGALASAFIPTFTGLLTKGDKKTAWNLASAVANLVTLVLVILCTLSAIFSPWVVVHILSPGFSDPAKIMLTAQLLRIQLIAPIIFGLSGLMMGVINAHQSFLWPALAPAMYSIGKIIGALFLAPHFGPQGLAWGVVIGAAMHCLVQLPALFKLPDKTYTFSLGLKSPQVREVVRLMGPRVIGVSIVQLNFIINSNLASPYSGATAAINYAFALMLIPEAFIAQATATAALPTFSAQVAQNKPEEMRSSMAVLLRGVLMLALPASLGLILLGQPLVALIYQYKEFTSTSTMMVAWALMFYAGGLVFHSVVEIVSRAFYALHDTRTPVTVGVVAMSLNVAFSFLFTWVFKQFGWMPHGGLALANSLATALETVGLLFFMRKRLGGLQLKIIGKGVFKAAIATTMMSLALWGWLKLSTGYSVVWVALGGLAVGVILYLVMMILLKVPEMELVKKVLLRFLPRKSSSEG
jgi:putative peptidoglycan lipid II flippase